MTNELHESLGSGFPDICDILIMVAGRENDPEKGGGEVGAELSVKGDDGDMESSSISMDARSESETWLSFVVSSRCFHASSSVAYRATRPCTDS